MNKEKFTLIGAGLAGPLLATYLAKRGYSVEMFERRQDMRKESISAGPVSYTHLTLPTKA